MKETTMAGYKHLPELLLISENGWDEEDFIFALRYHNHLIEVEDRVLAFLIYSIREKHIVIENIGVLPAVRRKGFGSHLIDEIKAFGQPIEITVPDDDLGMHLFLKEQGFVATPCGKEYVFRCSND